MTRRLEEVITRRLQEVKNQTKKEESGHKSEHFHPSYCQKVDQCSNSIKISSNS